MSDSCCSVPESDSPTAPESTSMLERCPACGSEGPKVDHSTVAALTRGLLAPNQQFRLCRDRACHLVYYGEQGDAYVVADLHVVPGFKTSGAEGLVCYCFMHSRGDIGAELEATGATTIPEQITAEINAGNCACEVRNPAGRCCLGEVNREVRRLRDRLAAEVA